MLSGEGNGQARCREKKGHQGVVTGKEPNDPEAPGPQTAEMAKEHFQQGVGEP